MALISDPGNNRSTFPTTVDSFTLVEDGHSSASAVDAEDFDQLATSILRSQEWGQKITHVVGSHDLKQITISAVVTVTGTPASKSGNITIAADKLVFFPEPWRAGIMLIPTVHSPVNRGVRISAKFTPRNVINYKFDDVDPSASLANGDYTLSFLIIG